MKEALKLALEALEGFYEYGYDRQECFEHITAIKAALAQPEQEQNNTYVYASNLAKTIWQKHYMKESPKFALLDTTEGVLTQIDNMTCGLVREKPAQQEPTEMLHIDRLDKWLDASLKERKAQPAQEPVAWSSYEYDGIHHKPVAWMDADGNFSDNNDHKCFPIPLYTITHPTPPQRTWVGLTDEEFQYCVELKNSEAIAEEVEAKLKELNT